MPRVEITYRSISHLHGLKEKLPGIVAEALSFHGGGVSPKNVSLRFSEANALDVGKDLYIEVKAYSYSKRLGNIDARAAEIVQSVKEIAPDLTIAVIIWLAPCGVAVA